MPSHPLCSSAPSVINNRNLQNIDGLSALSTVGALVIEGNPLGDLALASVEFSGSDYLCLADVEGLIAQLDFPSFTIFSLDGTPGPCF